MDGVRILQIILILGIIGVIIYLLRLYNTLKLEKRLARFATVSICKNDVSFFDNLYNMLWKVVKKVGKWFQNSEVINTYGSRYNKFISYKDRDKKDGSDYVVIKFLLGFLMVFLYLFTLVFSYNSFNFMVFLIVFLIGFFVVDGYLYIEFINRKKRIEEDLLRAIIIMNSAFQSGRNIVQAVEVVKNTIDGPIQDEFKKIYLDITYGLSLDVVFNRFYERVRLEDVKYITSSLTLLNKTGGDIIKVFSVIEKSIFDRKNLKNELKSLTAASRFVFKMLISLPFVFALLIFILNPSYFSPLFTSPFGVLALILILLLYSLYIFVIKKVLVVKI